VKNLKQRKPTNAVLSIFVAGLAFIAGLTFATDEPSIVIIKGDDIGQSSVTVPEITSLSSSLPEVPDVLPQLGPDSSPRPEPYTLLLLGFGLVIVSTLGRRIKK
jgi:hypothetical protein